MSSQNTNPSASIFKRLSEIPQPKYVSISDLTSSSKSFIIQTKRRGILGKSDRLLTIEDDYVHIAPNHQQQQLHQHPLVPNDPLVSNTTGKVASYHISQIVDCIFRPQAGFKLVVLRDSGEKRYDVEAENSQSASAFQLSPPPFSLSFFLSFFSMFGRDVDASPNPLFFFSQRRLSGILKA
jgi:hypothetical protein